jgi:hypothetical protein
VKLRFTSLPGNRNPLVSDGFEADETIPITVTYDSRGHPVVTSASPTIAEEAGGVSPSNYTWAVGLSATQQRELESVGVPRCSFTATGCWRSVPDQSGIYAIEGGGGRGQSVGAPRAQDQPGLHHHAGAQGLRPSGPVNTAKLVAAVKTVEKMPLTTYYMDLTIKLAALAALSPPIYPFGDLQLEVGQSYSDSTGKSLTADATTGLYVNPSGTVGTVSGISLPGARVVLERATKPGDPIHPVPNHSAIMSPANRRNPYPDRVSRPVRLGCAAGLLSGRGLARRLSRSRSPAAPHGDNSGFFRSHRPSLGW